MMRYITILCISITGSITCLEQLRAEYAWPAEKPNVDERHLSLFGNASQLRKILSTYEINIIVELGSWLGGSAKFFLKNAPQATVIAIDHWTRIAKEGDKFANLAPILYETFLANCWHYRTRLIPLRARTIEGLKKIHSYNIKPDLIYIDAKHDYESVMLDITTSCALFPDAIITGDDWDWGASQNYPVKRAVTTYAKVHNLKIKSERNFWMLLRER